MPRESALSRRIRSSTPRARASAAVALAVVSLFSMVGIQITGNAVAGAATPGTLGTGFVTPFAGSSQYVHLAPTLIANSRQLNQPIGQAVADKLAKKLGLRKADTFTEKQYVEFVSGLGIGGDPSMAKLVDESVRILTNTTGRPLYSDVNGRPTPSVLASYGVFVNTSGLLESPANLDAPTRQVNTVIAPGGYMDTWCRANGATAAVVTLYKSAFTVETVYGTESQRISSPAQLVVNTKRHKSVEVGMSMAPALWIVNFALIYTLNPSLAADMPAFWAPIPSAVADALLASPSGQVPYGQYESAFK